MDQHNVRQIWTEILSAAVNETRSVDGIKQTLTPELLASVYRLAKKHDLAHVVADFVQQQNITAPFELQQQLRKEQLLAIYRTEQMKLALAEICGVFDSAGIAYIPLKGSVLRPYYPYEHMRTSCDIDILVREETLAQAIGALEDVGYTCDKRGYHDVSLYSPSKIHLELHFNLLENHDRLDPVLAQAWQYAVPVTATRYAFSDAFFAFHMLAHMSYHFVTGGCGFRSLLDIWVMEHRMGVSYACAKELLQQAGIYRFASEMSRLSEQCFTEHDDTVFSDPVLAYIFDGGVYGSAENHIAVGKSKSNSAVVYAFKRLFLPYKSMTVLFPILKKAPVLLPFCWVARWVMALFGGKSKKFASELSCAKNLSDSRIDEINEILLRLGLSA